MTLSNKKWKVSSIQKWSPVIIRPAEQQQQVPQTQVSDLGKFLVDHIDEMDAYIADVKSFNLITLTRQGGVLTLKGPTLSSKSSTSTEYQMT